MCVGGWIELFIELFKDHAAKGLIAEVYGRNSSHRQVQSESEQGSPYFSNGGCRNIENSNNNGVIVPPFPFLVGFHRKSLSVLPLIHRNYNQLSAASQPFWV
jgi:hypothetical protein